MQGNAYQSQTQAGPEYIERIDRVIDFMRDNLDRPVSLAELARVACFSEFHFHRIFGSLTGETVLSFTHRLRLEKAARLLRYSRRRVTDIALECGFSSSATFSRAFRAGFHTSPSTFRKSETIPESKICKDLFVKEDYILPMSSEEKRVAFPVSIVEFGERRGAYIRVSDAFDSRRVLGAFERIAHWARFQGVWSNGTLFGMSLDDPHVTPKKLYTYEVCMTYEAPVECAPGMSELRMPARRYAVTRVAGDLRRVATAWDYLFRDWLLQSSYEPEHAPALEIFRDKEKATDWSHFDLDLCLPVRRLTAKAR